MGLIIDTGLLLRFQDHVLPQDNGLHVFEALDSSRYRFNDF